MRLCRALLLAVIGGLAALPVPARAGSPTEQLRPALQEVLRILEDPSFKAETKAAERQARVLAAGIDLFDFPEMARRTLGLHWRPLSQPEREEFVRLFRRLLEHTYLPKIALYHGERVRFIGESVEGDLATVQSLIITRNSQEFPVSYRLHQQDGRWLVYDISIEGISLVGNYRSQFSQIIQRSSYQELVRRIEQKLASAPSPGAPEALSPARGKRSGPTFRRPAPD